MDSLPIIIGIILVIGVLLVLASTGVLGFFVKMFTMVYDAVRPQGGKQQAAVIIISICYGFFALYMMGGPIGALMPFFINPVGSLIAFIVLFFGYFLVVFVLKIFLASPSKVNTAVTLSSPNFYLQECNRVKEYKVLCSKKLGEDDLKKLSESPKNVNTHYILGMYYSIVLGNDDLAVSEYETFLKLNQLEPYAHFKLAYSLANKGFRVEAENHFKEATRLMTGNIFIQYWLAKNLEKQNKIAEAIAEYKKIFRRFNIEKNTIQSKMDDSPMATLRTSPLATTNIWCISYLNDKKSGRTIQERRDQIS